MPPTLPDRRLRHGTSSPGDPSFDLSSRVELVILAVKERAARCRLLGTDAPITLRSSGLWRAVPGEIVTVRPRKHWRYRGRPYLSGDIEDWRVDVAALGLTPLRLEPCGTWDPAEEYWGEDGDAIGEWAQPIIAHGPRPEFEMEQVLPGADPNDPDLSLRANATMPTLAGMGATSVTRGESRRASRRSPASSPYQGVDVRRKKRVAFSHMSFCVAGSPSDWRHAITVSA